MKCTYNVKLTAIRKLTVIRMHELSQEIVALSGAHTLGRSYPHRSGLGASLDALL